VNIVEMMQLKTISDRLEKLQSEREELLEYHRLDRQKRAIEYRILDKDRVDVVAQINEVCL
jgi:chromosome segregation ATPase